MDIIQVITQELHVEKWQVEAAVKLIDEGNTDVYKRQVRLLLWSSDSYL